jgi:hypothetical protein
VIPALTPQATGDSGDAAPAEKKSIKVPVPKLDVDIKQLVTWNFLVQLALTAISWAVVFFTSHATMARVRIQPPHLRGFFVLLDSIPMTKPKGLQQLGGILLGWF